MKRTFLLLVGAAVGSAALVAQSVPEINYDANADIISLPSYGEVAGVATNSRGHVFVYAQDRSRGGDARRRAHVLSRRLAAVSIRSGRQVREGDRPGRLRGQLRAAGPRRSAGQRVDRRCRIEPGREVRRRRAVPAGARPQAGEHHAAARPRRAGDRRRTRRFSRRAAAHRPRAVAAVAAVVAAMPAGRLDRASTATASTGRRT